MCGVWLPLYVVSTRFSFKGVATGRGGGGGGKCHELAV